MCGTMIGRVHGWQKRSEAPRLGHTAAAGASASPRHGDYRCAVSNSFGFGGENAALLFGAY
jgi:3-oxoacyl-(acyl-carrier-protein) synthase